MTLFIVLGYLNSILINWSLCLLVSVDVSNLPLTQNDRNALVACHFFIIMSFLHLKLSKVSHQPRKRYKHLCFAYTAFCALAQVTRLKSTTFPPTYSDPAARLILRLWKEHRL